MAKRPIFVGRAAVVGVAHRPADDPQAQAGQDGVRDIEGEAARPQVGPPLQEGARVTRAVEEPEPSEAEPVGAWRRVRAVVRRGWRWLTEPEDDLRSSIQKP